jgi:peptide chain release factor 1
MENKVQKLLSRIPEIEDALGQPGVISDQKKYRNLMQEHSYLINVQTVWNTLRESEKQLENNRELLKSERDPDFRLILEEDVQSLNTTIEENQERLEQLLIPPDPNDNRNAIVEIRAGTGGDEAALFVGDCVRMYKMFADKMKWRYEELSSTQSELGGYKEYVMVLSGPSVYRFLKYEGGTHRVQRVPETEAQGRVHTSAITIAIMLEPDEEQEVKIDEKELRVDTYRSSGAGGQHVNTTDSAVRLTHLPTGIVVYCQEERSQHKNKDKAMRLLKTRIADAEQQRKDAARASDRAKQVGSGDRSERIRTYNFSQNRISDHRIEFTRYNLDRVMEGDLQEVTQALVQHFHKKRLEEI